MTSHAAWPLVWAFERLPRTQSWGRLLAHVVAGHHAGLKDDLLSPEGRIETNNALLAPVERAAQADGLALPGSVSGPAGMRFLKGERGFQMAFLTRMIFSCLIDADRTAAAAFDAHGVGIPEIEHPSITALETALHEAMGRRVVEPNQINTLRDEVLRAAVARAAEPQGVFTLTVPTGGGKTLRRRQDRAALGRYTVGVPRTVRSEMIAKRIAEVIRSEEFGDQFVVLHNLDLYTSETGLDWDDITFRGTDTMIIG